jgi:SAM-dependent methyltransferase
MNNYIKMFAEKILSTFSRKVYYNFNKIRYEGTKYFCPICEQGFNEFLTGPDKSRKNSKCPGCGSLERQRLLWLYLTRRLEIKNQKITLLNIAPDYATQTALKKLKDIDYISIDLNSSLAIKKNDITNLDFKDNCFDAIICYHVLEHVEDDRKAMSELFRVLKLNGWAILQSPIENDRAITFEDETVTTPSEKLGVFGQEDHVRIYGRDYNQRLAKAGFVVREDGFIYTLTQIE